jgi:FkbM family methyltransferase
MPQDSRFLDIGAWHPTRFSNTRALYELGWSGVMIEPSPQPMLNLLDVYGFDERVTLIQAAVSLECGLVPLHITDDATSTSSGEQYERWRNDGPAGEKGSKFRGHVYVPTITLEQIANQFGGFQFWNIDAEGSSADLFLQMLKLGLYPAVVCCEHDERAKEILTAATAQHYRCVLVNSTNLVVVRG